MKYQLEFADGVDRQIAKFKRSNAAAFRKFVNILNELEEHPRTGIGHPEPLKGYGGLTWSRHITKKDRIIYNIHDDVVMVMIITIEGNYNDK